MIWMLKQTTTTSSARTTPNERCTSRTFAMHGRFESWYTFQPSSAKPKSGLTTHVLHILENVNHEDFCIYFGFEFQTDDDGNNDDDDDEDGDDDNDGEYDDDGGDDGDVDDLTFSASFLSVLLSKASLAFCRSL